MSLSNHFPKDDDEDFDGGHSLVRVTRATPILPPGVTDDTPDFKRDEVMLDVDPQLAGQSLSLVLNLSTVFGEWLMVKLLFHSKLIETYYALIEIKLFSELSSTICSDCAIF